MRAYLVEDLYEEDVAKIEEALKSLGLAGPLEGIYYLPLPEDLLDDEQREHAKECGPHILGLEIHPDALKMELLVRARGRLRCSCVKYCNPAQRAHMIDYLDGFVRDLGVSS